ncbi:hypothetical protein [Flavobacterium celericrescens]|uniref:Uncharacterized protein n=1 Tax=Flavobacterium celericrescens TaxID=2709780 RepID=A0ABX0IDG7_9FLAO|nr:hypothetical protein [Flavobacterium celericrescens]NHM03732.1 hypothetical protein [Flavobacterium celericrescens]
METIKKFSINKDFNSLNFLENLAKKFDLYLIGDFEVEPFTKWSMEFASEYWYLNYHLLKKGEVRLGNQDSELKFLFQESNLNIIWLTVTDKKNFELKCVDGSWEVKVLNPNFDRLQELLNI